MDNLSSNRNYRIASKLNVERPSEFGLSHGHSRRWIGESKRESEELRAVALASKHSSCYGSCSFDYWLGTQSTSNPLPVLLMENVQVAAVYDCGDETTTTTMVNSTVSTSPSSQQYANSTVQSVNQNGTAIVGYTVLYSDRGTGYLYRIHASDHLQPDHRPGLICR
jgi:hypothetical protein